MKKHLRCPYCVNQYTDDLEAPASGSGGIESTCPACNAHYMVALDNFVEDVPDEITSADFDTILQRDISTFTLCLWPLRLKQQEPAETPFPASTFQDLRTGEILDFEGLKQRILRNRKTRSDFYQSLMNITR